MASRSAAHTAAPAPAPRAPAAPRALRTAQADASPAVSPARMLQDELGARLTDGVDASGGGRWSARRTLALAVCASAALWGGIAAGGYLLLRL